MINSIVLLVVVQNGILNGQAPLLFKYHLLLTKLAYASTEEWVCAVDRKYEDSKGKDICLLIHRRC